MLGDAASYADLGEDFGATLSEREVRWLMDQEYARAADDIVWRRTKLGLKLKPEDIAALDSWMDDHLAVPSGADDGPPSQARSALGGGR
jgi:glycerol-3-phosphate dehydrogenase